MRVKEIKKNLLWNLGNSLSSILLNVLCKSLFIEEKQQEVINKLLHEKQNFVFAFWHGTMILPWYFMRNYNLSTIISQSKDGEVLTRVLTKWGYQVKRGSSSKGGKEVLEELISDAENSKSIAITPDGPRGPEREMKAGAVIVAKKTSTPIVLAGVAYKNRIKLKSWDHFEVPMFFSKAYIKFSEPIYVDGELSYEDTDALISELSKKLNALQNEMEMSC